MTKADDRHSTSPPQSTTDPIFAAIAEHQASIQNTDANERLLAADLTGIGARRTPP